MSDKCDRLVLGPSEDLPAFERFRGRLTDITPPAPAPGPSPLLTLEHSPAAAVAGAAAAEPSSEAVRPQKSTRPERDQVPEG